MDERTRLIDMLADLLDTTPESGQILYFMLEFFRFLNEEYGAIPVPPDKGAAEDYSAFVDGLLRLIPDRCDSEKRELSQKLLVSVANTLSPESDKTLSERERLNKMFDLLTVQDEYHTGTNASFERAVKQYLSAGLKQIEADMVDFINLTVQTQAAAPQQADPHPVEEASVVTETFDELDVLEDLHDFEAFVTPDVTTDKVPFFFPESSDPAPSLDGPRVLIIHSNSYQAYTPSEAHPYIPFNFSADPYRTEDTSLNVIRLGKEMAQSLQDLGIEVLHDYSLRNSLSDDLSDDAATQRTRQALQHWLSQYPSIQAVLDVRRGTPIVQDEPTVSAIAPIQLVVGNRTTPPLVENLVFAERLEHQLAEEHGSLVRPMALCSTSGLNQDLLTYSLQVNIGSANNTLDDAITSSHLFAHALTKVLEALPR